MRGLRRTPGFTAVALAILILAIGANTVIFSLVDQLLVRPLPYRDADRLVVLEAMRDVEGAPRPVRAAFQLDAAQRWQEALHVFEETAFFSDASLQLTTREGSEIVSGALVSPAFFSTVGGPMATGRPIGPADALSPAVVISDRLARRLFNGSSQAIGGQLVINSSTFVVVGVAGPEWDVPSWKTDVWESAAFARTLNPQCCGVQLLGRLKAGATIAQASADVRETVRALATVDTRSFGRLHPMVTSLRNQQLGDSRSALLLLWAAAAVVLIVACANLLNLLVSRNLARAREITIRQALGASRGRLVLQGLIESGLLAAGGVAGGLLVARVSTATLTRVDPETLPRLHDVHVDLPVLGFAVSLGVATTLTTGILPSLHSPNALPLRTISNLLTRRRRRLQQLLCIGQLGAAVVLLVSATLLGRSLVNLIVTDLGVMPHDVMTASVNVALGRPHSAAEVATTMQRVVERVQQVPGVRAVGAGTSLPPDTSRIRMSLKRKAGDVDYVASAVACTPGYFQALGIRLVKGRFFTASDDPQHPPVIIVSAETARHLFGDVDPLGQTLGVPKMPYSLMTGNNATVVGVVDAVKYSGMDAAPGDQVYWSLAQAPWLSTFLTIRTGGAVNLASTLRNIVASVDPTIAVSAVRPLDSIIAAATTPARFRTFLIGAFAGLGLVIAAVGLYGMVAYSVSQRTAELGVRVALGAATCDVMALVVGEGVAIGLAGVAVGLPAAYVASRSFHALLFGVASTDKLTYVISAAALLLTAVAASYAPARRAARVDPIMALRAE